LLSLLFAGAFGLRTSSHASKLQTQSAVAATAGAKPVFYVIVMGKLAYRHQISLWLSSLRKLGGYKDEVVLVTDKPECLAKTLGEAKLLGERIRSDDNVDIFAPGQGYSGNIHMMKRPSHKAIWRMKMEKTRAWENVKLAAVPHAVSSIIYTDEDLVIGKDLTEFVSIVRDTEKESRTLALFRDTGASKGQLHTGVVVIFPGEKTEACLVAWGKHLTQRGLGRAHRFKEVFDVDTDELILTQEEMEAMGPDQKALGSTGACKSKNKGDDAGIKILPKDFFWFPTKKGLEQDQKAEFVHFTNTGRWKTISHTLIKEYLVRLGVPEHIDPMGTVQDKTCVNDGTLTAIQDEAAQDNGTLAATQE